MSTDDRTTATRAPCRTTSTGKLAELLLGDLARSRPRRRGDRRAHPGPREAAPATQMDETLEGHDLSYGEWKLLVQAAPRSRTAPRRRASSPANLELSSGAMTNRIDQLERAGHVERHPDPHDRRGVRVELTDARPRPPGASRRTRRRSRRPGSRARSRRASSTSSTRPAAQAHARVRARRARSFEAAQPVAVKCSQPPSVVRLAVEAAARRPRPPRRGRSPGSRRGSGDAASSS